jgi:endonuclease YncB( thermonuclease family)
VSLLNVKHSETAEVTAYGEPLSGCSVTDGDTIRCGGERIRLLGIDAPELPGHCRQGRNCAPGDPYASTASLETAMVGSLTIERVGEDHYGRTLAVVAGDKGDLSCWQLAHDQVIYKADWDNGLRVARNCPAAIF